ncbi:MAG: hypothetical protein EBU90_05045 [Proteobacteria bacterium]|nr:hypothetical protein [Pseudomonadota bacterium]
MNVIIGSNLLGSKKNLSLSTDGVSWVEKIQNDSWCLSGEIKQDHDFCLDTVSRLNHMPPSPTVHEKYKKSMHSLMEGNPPWSMILPKQEYKKFFDDIINYSKELKNAETDYYLNAWVPGNKILNMIKPAKTDAGKINDIVSTSAVNSHVVETFRPRSGGYAFPVTYDRFGTVTGRLVVSSGPSILLLKKNYRNILKPSFPDGKIVSLDFSSLEARILLYESGNDCSEPDLYQMLSNKFGGMSREMVKAAVLAVLYGSSKSAVALHLGTSEEKIAKLIVQIEDYISTKSLLKRLKQEHKTTGFIKNRFGRKIPVDRMQDNIFINYYAQSTGVDVSLMGFSNIMDVLGIEGIRPIFVLHDALILDVHPDRLADVSNVSKTKVHGYDQEFPIKFEEISM